jgi:hypothetical protein
MSPGRAPQNHPLTPKGDIKPEWIQLLNEFPDRFVIGGDQFCGARYRAGPGRHFCSAGGNDAPADKYVSRQTARRLGT